MKKILIVLLTLALLLSTLSFVSFAADIYQLEISVFDMNGRPMDLTNASYQIQSGDSNYTHIIASPNTDNYENRNYRMTTAIDVKVDFNVMSITSEVDSDINVMISNDMGLYHYHLEEIISFSSFSNGSKLALEYHLSDLDKVNFNLSTDSKSDGTLTYYLFKKTDFDKGRKEDVRSSGTAQQSTEKTFYVSKGSYELTLISIENDTMHIYKDNLISSSRDETIIIPNEFFYRTYQLFHKDLYDTHERVELICTLNGPDFYHREFVLDYNTPLTIKCYDPNGESVAARLYRPNSTAVSENFSLSPIIKKTDDVYPNRVGLSTWKDKIKLNIETINVKSSYQHIDKQYFLDGITFEFYNQKTKELVQSNTYYSDIVDFIYPENKDIEYEIKITFAEYFQPTYFISSYVKEHDIYQFNFLETEKNRSKPVVEDIHTSLNNYKYTFSLDLDNESSKLLDYELLLSDKGFSEKKNLLLDGQNSGKIYIECPKIILKKYPDLKLTLTKNDEELLNVSVIDLIAKDISGHWGYSVMSTLLANGDIYTRDGFNYYPDEAITRGEFSVFLANALDLSIGSKNIEFNDISMSHPIYESIMIAATNGLISGRPDGSFDPDAPISRQDVTVIINNALKLKDIFIESKPINNKYIDISSISSYATESMKNCISEGIISGKSNTTINPKDMVTRAETAIIINHTINLIMNYTSSDSNSDKTETTESIIFKPVGNTNYNIATRGYVAFDDQWDYVITKPYQLNSTNLGGVYRVNKDRTESHQLSSLDASYINIDDECIYFIEGQDSSYVVKMKKDGTDREIILNDKAYNLMLVGDYLYYTLDYPENNLWRMNKDGNNQKLIGLKDVYHLQYSDGYIYYLESPYEKRHTDNLAVYRVNENTFEREKIVEYEFNPKHSSFMYVVDGNWIYYIKNGDLFRCNLVDENIQQLTKNFNLASFFFVDDKIYCHLFGTGPDNIIYAGFHRVMYKMNKDGSNQSLIPHGSDLLYMNNPAGQTESKTFFWDGTFVLDIYEIKFDGTDKQALIDYSAEEIREHLNITKPLEAYNQYILMRIIKKIVDAEFMTIENTESNNVHYRKHDLLTGRKYDYYLQLDKGHLLDNNNNLFFDLSQYFNFN